jgi:polar amino acid transport system substrate-binding protein
MNLSYVISRIIIFVTILSYIPCLLAAPLPTNSSTNTNNSYAPKQGNVELYKCIDAGDKKTLTNGWYLWEPYQFNQVTGQEYKLVGMDVDLTKTIAKKMGINVRYDSITWSRHQRELRDGKRDMASGATYTEERAAFSYFSIPYRFEENSLFISKRSDKKLSFRNISEYLVQIKLQNFRLGVIKGFIYADPKITSFIADTSNSDIIFFYDTDEESLEALLKNDIDGFMCDRIVGAALILDKNVGNKVREIPLKIKTPIHFMFSKASVPLDLVNRFNTEIRKFVTGKEYKNIAKSYIYPVLLLETIDSEWFYVVGLIGTIAFAISGVAIAAKDNCTFFATMILAIIPSIGGGIMRDVIINRATIGIILTPSYIYYILLVVVTGFATLRLLNYYNSDAYEDTFLQKFWHNLLVICDAIGQAAFIVTGVSIVIVMRIEPIALWGPFFAFLTSNGGGMLRDLMRNREPIVSISEEINPEISIIWALIFSIFLDSRAYSYNSESITYVVIAVVCGAFITRLLVHYFKIPNIRFHA